MYSSYNAWVAGKESLSRLDSFYGGSIFYGGAMVNLISRLPIMLIVWAAQLAVKVPTMLLGFLVVPFTYKYRNTPLKYCPWYLMPWINPEDQYGGYPGYPNSLPDFWVKREGTSMLAHYKYHAIRNPADGLRNFSILQCKLEPEKVRFLTNKLLEYYEPYNPESPRFSYYIAWQGMCLGVQFHIIWSDTRYLIFKFGYRIDPGDALAPPLPGSTVDVLGVSMASKFLPYREYRKR